MSDSLTLITCTGDRPEAMALCGRWMSRQSYEDDFQWVVVDDGKTPLQESMQAAGLELFSPVCIDYVRREPQEGEGHTLRQNLLAAIPHVKKSKVLFIEDDDWYHPDYLRNMSLGLDHHKLYGEGRARYYNVATRRWKTCNNEDRASLCQTGMWAEDLDRLCWQIRSNKSHFVDARLWRDPCIRNKKVIFSQGWCVGIKGLPGRTGIGIGHRLNDKNTDLNCDKLREWIGEDARYYQGFFQRKT